MSAGSLASGSSASSTVTAATSSVRQVTSDPSPFVWGGLLPTLGLSGLLLWAWWAFAPNDIEANVKRQIEAELRANGHGWVQVAVSGQHVLLSGTPPGKEAPDDALARARAATCASWIGPQTCAVQVVGAFAAVQVPAPPNPTPTPAAAAATPAAQAAACERSLAAELEGQRVEFASGSAVIASRSNALLDRLAAAARACAGTLVVEGHTDNVGSAAANQSLSQARAEAVRAALVQRGLAAERLSARGFGLDRPLADNDSAEGRARNRRIEFRAGS
jgi:outer membrane protein OmpA-like peptidoglycan-associated protein